MESGSDASLAEVPDAHLDAEFTTQDLDAAMATMADDPYLAHVPVQVGPLDPAGLTVVGALQAEKLRAPRALPSNELLQR